MYSKDIKNKVVSDYFNSNLTIDQIAKKYNICIRSVYGWTHSERNKRRDTKKTYPLKLTKKELEILQCTLFNLQCSLFNYSDSLNYPDYAAIANSLRNRIIDKLQSIEEIEKANT